MRKCMKCHSHDIIESEKGIYCCNCGWDSEKEQYAKKKTNADRIRSMSDEELAELLDSVDNGGIRALDVDYPCDECTQKTECEDCFKEWLQSEVEKQKIEMY